jgi:hypothetical protein
MLDKSAQAGRHATRVHIDDCYDTPPCAVRALLKVEHIPRHVWEPAAGTGNIASVLRAHGHEVFASDKLDRGCPGVFVFNYLRPLRMPLAPDAVVTNPPYRFARRFVELSLERAPLVCMLLRLAFLESSARAGILDGGKLSRVHVFANRLPMMHRAGWTGKRASSAMAFAWFVWDRNYRGPTLLDRIFWERETDGN